MAIGVGAAPSTQHSGTQHTDYRAMSIATMLFFMWGFLTCLNDILIPHLKGIFDLNYAQAMLVQFCFFMSYFVFALPAGKLVEWRGYKGTMVIGLLVMAVGAFLFLPASTAASFGLFLSALVILAAGITSLQVAANPYVAHLGPPETSSSRLNLAQAFNSFGTFVAPFFGSALILSATQVSPETMRSYSAEALQQYRMMQASSVRLPYLGIGLTLVLLAIAFAVLKMPTMDFTQDIRPGELAQMRRAIAIWRHPVLLAGALGIFVYVGAEVSIGSFLVNYFGLAGDCALHGEDGGEVCFAVLGRGDGGAVYRLVAADEAEDEHGAGFGCCGGGRAGGDVDPDAWAHGDVGDYCGRAVQLGDVSEHLYGWVVRAGAADFEGFELDGGGDCGRGADSAGRRTSGRSDWGPPCVCDSGGLLCVYRGVWIYWRAEVGAGFAGAGGGGLRSWSEGTRRGPFRRGCKWRP